MDNNESFSHVYFIGIGGVSMSGLAEIMKHKGFQVSGSDIKESATIRHLRQIGIPVAIGHRKENIVPDVDLVVYTAAVKEDNPEMIEAHRRNIPVMDRAELLGKVMDSYALPIAVSGTHGKTTTSSMIADILLTAQKDPTISIGGFLPSIDSNIRIGGQEYFVAEACEYFDSFLKFRPAIAVILNIEEDHLDYFKDIHQIRHSFQSFAGKVPETGTVIIHSAIDNPEEITKDTAANVITYGFDPETSQWTADHIVHLPNGKNSFDVIYQGQNMGRICLQVPGEHNISNALAACAACYAAGIDMESIRLGLGAFTGTKRRFQYKGVFQGVTVIDDYAHHPTEIKATLAAAQNVEHHTIWCVFQPHTYTRTKALLEEFSTAFSNADQVIIADIFAAREKDTGLIHSRDLVARMIEKGIHAQYMDSFQTIASYLRKHCKPGDLVITMGAGDVYLIGESLTE